MNNTNILVTGGCGFIGSNFIRYLFDNYTNVGVLNLDFMGHGSNNYHKQFPYGEGNIYHHYNGDISKLDRIVVDEKDKDVKLPFDIIFNFAAESHVDRSISTPRPFIESNVMGTLQMLEFARKMGCRRFVQVSTDEVYGSADEKDYSFEEFEVYNPSSVYSASKASAEMLCSAYSKTYGMDIVITRCSNNYGPLQFEEKLIPKVIHNALNDIKIPVYDEGTQRREWSYVDDHIEDLITVAMYGGKGHIYNVGDGYEMDNLSLVKKILKVLDKPESLIEFVPNARPGHDFRYAINTNKLHKLKSFINIQPREITEEYFTKKLTETIEYYKSAK